MGCELELETWQSVVDPNEARPELLRPLPPAWQLRPWPLAHTSGSDDDEHASTTHHPLDMHFVWTLFLPRRP